MITPDQAWGWASFKSEGGPTYAGGVGWKRYTDFLISKMPEFGAVDLDYVEIPYDHYIVDDWPDRRTHIYDSGNALEKLVSAHAAPLCLRAQLVDRMALNRDRDQDGRRWLAWLLHVRAPAHLSVVLWSPA